MEQPWRRRAAGALGRYFARKRWPRLSLGLVVVFTGLAGFGLSFALWKCGLAEMWLRYPIAVGGAYLVFLGLLRIWVEIERTHFNPQDPEIISALEEEPARERERERKASWLDALDLPDFGGVDSLEGCAVGILVTATIGLLAVLISFVAGAPFLIGEVAVDVFIVSILYRRLKAAEREHWLGAAVRQTWPHVLAIMALLAIIGACLGILAPGAQTLGEAFRLFFAR